MRKVRVHKYVPADSHKSVGLDESYSERVEAKGEFQAVVISRQMWPRDPEGNETLWKMSLSGSFFDNYNKFYMKQKHLEFLDGEPPKNTVMEQHDKRWEEYRNQKSGDNDV